MNDASANAAPDRRDAGHSTVSTVLRDDVEVWARLVEATVRTTGEGFFQALVRHLAAAVGARYAFVAEFAGTNSRVRTIAFWNKDHVGHNVEWDLDGTPCQDVVRGEVCHHPVGVARKFPHDEPLVAMGIESYLGVPLRDSQGRTIGHLAVFDDRPMPEEPRRMQVFRLFAERAAAELDRSRIEALLRDSEERLRDLFEEAPIPYVYEDTDSRFVRANRAFMNLLGLSPGDIPGTMGVSLVASTPGVQDRLQLSLAAEQAGHEAGCIEIELRRKDTGQSVWVQRWSRPEPDGKHTRTMIVDITARVLAERERARLQQQNTYLREEIKTEHNFEEIVGNSSNLRHVLARVGQVAATDATVLLTGETGTGKELIARAIHDTSHRKDRPLIKLNCAALPTGLIESELFGHEKGAFTGALERRPGRFALADGGTIFLDEVGDVPADVQVRLLRVLQEHEFEPVGSPKTVRVDVRVIAATNKDLHQAVADGSFRADLFYRLNVFPIELPPLRERHEDIPLLTQHFLAKYAARMGKRIDRVTPETMQRLLDYPWPGNIRELENVIERAVILSTDGTLDVELHSLRVPAPRASIKAGNRPRTAADRDLTMEESERRHVLATLDKTRWVIDGPRGAAKLLGLHPNTLRSRIKRLGLTRPHDDS